MCANICPLLKQNYPYNPNGIHISMYVMLCVSGTLAWSQWFTNLHVGYLYVCACVCVCKEDHARFNTSDIFYPTFPFKNREKGGLQIILNLRICRYEWNIVVSATMMIRVLH